jgi:hypothetical protein
MKLSISLRIAQKSSTHAKPSPLWSASRNSNTKKGSHWSQEFSAVPFLIISVLRNKVRDDQGQVEMPGQRHSVTHLHSNNGFHASVVRVRAARRDQVVNICQKEEGTVSTLLYPTSNSNMAPQKLER